MRGAADGLVDQAERLLAGEPVDDAVLEAGLAPLWRAPTLDTVVLGCTHFPLLRDLLNARAPRPVQWVDSGSAIARRVAQVIDQYSHRSSTKRDESWATDADRFALIRCLPDYGFLPPQRLAVLENAD